MKHPGALRMTREPARTRPRRVLDFLSSGRLAVCLLALLVVILLLCIFVPQWSESEAAGRALWIQSNGLPAAALHTLGLTALRRSPWLWGAGALLAVNLSLCMIRRVPLVVAAAALADRPSHGAAFPATRQVQAPVAVAGAVSEVLRRRGYATTGTDDAVYGIRGRFALAGHWIFHLGLLVILTGAFLAAAAGPPFKAGMVVGEGEAFDLHGSSLLGSTEPVTDAVPPLAFTLAKIDARTEGLEVRGFQARLSTPDGAEVTMGINRPYRVAPYQVLAQGFGYMPGWVIVDARGRMVRGAWLKMAPFPFGGEEVIRIGPRTSEVRVTFYPDHDMENGEDRSRTFDLRNPRFRATVLLRGETIFDGLLEPGRKVPLDDGRSFLFLPEIRMYGIFDVARDQGHRTLFAGFGLAVLGLFIRYGRIRKEILVEVTTSGLRVHGRSELLESLFEEELDRLAGEMAGSLPALRPRESEA